MQVFNRSFRDKKVVGVFVAFRAPLHFDSTVAAPVLII
jgi:hypothetical protein